jgi:hypothetical protein
MNALLFLTLLLFSDYEYQLDPVVIECDTKYGRCCWSFCKILKIPYEIKDSLNLPSFFRGFLIDGSSSTREIDPGIVWENDVRDSSYIVIQYWSKQSPQVLKYKVYWFIK